MNVDFLMKFYGEFEEYDSRFLVCEYCNGGILEDIIENKKKLQIPECLLIIFEIAIGVNLMHRNGLTHRDLKGDNIFIHNGIYKIGDFGFSNDKLIMNSMLGTPLFMAPEIIEISEKGYDNKVDIWSLAVILYKLITKEYYFYADRRIILYNKIVSKPYIIPKKYSKKWSSVLQDLFKKCFKKKPEERPSIQEFLDHEVFTEIKGSYALKKKQKNSANRLFKITEKFRKLDESREKYLNQLKSELNTKKLEVNRLEKFLSKEIELTRLMTGESLVTSKKSVSIAKSMENQTEFLLGKIAELEKKNNQMKVQQHNLFEDMIYQKRQKETEMSMLYTVMLENLQ